MHGFILHRKYHGDDDRIVHSWERNLSAELLSCICVSVSIGGMVFHNAAGVGMVCILDLPWFQCAIIRGNIHCDKDDNSGLETIVAWGMMYPI